MKKKMAFLAAILCLLLLTACGGGGKNAVSADMAPVGPEGIDNNSSGWDELGYGAAQAAPEEAPMDAPVGGTSTGSAGGLPANTKMIYTADINLETKDFDGACAALDAIVEELGGWFESRSVDQGGYSRSLSCTVRVPAEHFGGFLDRAGETAHVTSKTEYKEDVSEAYYDSESRLATQRTKLERLQTLLAQAAGMEDIIALESAISETELQIEQLTGSLRKYDSLVGYSTVHLYLWEVYRLSTDEEVPVTFGQRLGAAFSTGFQRGVEGLEDLVISLARNWLSLLMLAAVAAAAVVVLIRWRRARRRKAALSVPRDSAPPQSPDGEKKE